MKISWRDGFRSSGADAEKVYQEIEIIRRRDGGIKPEAVLKQAKRKTSSMNKMFEWDDSKAAESYRVEQARGILRSISVVYSKAPKVKTRVFHTTTAATATEDDKPRKIYQSTEELLKDPIARDELLAGAIRDALSFRRKYHCLSELAGVFKVIDGFVVGAEKMLEIK